MSDFDPFWTLAVLLTDDWKALNFRFASGDERGQIRLVEPDIEPMKLAQVVGRDLRLLDRSPKQRSRVPRTEVTTKPS